MFVFYLCLPHLIAGSSRSPCKLNLTSCTEVCLMPGECHLPDTGKITCDTCEGWYHCVCVGVGSQITKDDKFKFSRCAKPPKNEMYVRECYNALSSM